MSRPRNPEPKRNTSPADQPTVIPLAVAHYGLATSRGFRRGFLEQLRELVSRLPADGVLLDIHVQCREGGACCRAEPLDVTAARLVDTVEDWTGARYVTVIPENAG